MHVVVSLSYERHMMGYPIPQDEAGRLRALQECGVLDTIPEVEFDRITRLAAEICRAPIARISLVDSDREWYKSVVGGSGRQGPREHAFCAHAIMGTTPLVVENTLADPRFSENPMVLGGEAVRFYAGAPIRTDDAHALGAVCVLDVVPRSLTTQQVDALETLAQHAAALLDTRRKAMLLMQASRAKERLLSNVGHELRTPLTTIDGFSALLEQPGATVEQLEAFARSIRSASASLLAKLNDILDVAALDGDQIVIDPRPTDLSALVRECAQEFRSKAEEKGITLDVAAPARAALVAADPIRLRQVVSNLISNAVNATDSGGVRVELTQSNEGEGTARAEFTVSDTGVGIPDSERERVFEPFSKLRDGLARRDEGLGLGLPVARRILDRMGATIEIESEPGKGTRAKVRLALPLARQPSGSGLPMSGTKILLVEDGKLNQKLICHILKKAGAEVSVCEDGQEAVDQARDEKRMSEYDLVIMDLQMPRMDGIQATAAIRALGWRTPIISLTAEASERDRERCLAAGCDDFMTKPFDHAHFIETCVRCMASRASA